MFVGFGSDTPTDMFGKHNFVASNLKLEKPCVVAIKCSCHLAHLVASQSTTKLPNNL